MTEPHEAELRWRITEAASALFLEKGFKGVSMTAIARLAGCTPGAMYWHFNSKADIFAAVLEENFADFFGRIQTNVNASEPDARLYQVIRTHVLSQLEVHELQGPAATTFTIAQLVTALPESKQQKIRRMQRDYLELIEKILRDGCARSLFEVDHVRTTAFSLINLAEYVIVWFRPNRALSVAETAHLHAVLALRMVSADVPSALAKLRESDAEMEGLTR